MLRYRQRSNSYVEAQFNSVRSSRTESCQAAPDCSELQSIYAMSMNTVIDTLLPKSRLPASKMASPGDFSSRPAVVASICKPEATARNISEFITGSIEGWREVEVDYAQQAAATDMNNTNDADVNTSKPNSRCIYAYHPNNVPANETGFFGNLTKLQITALGELRARCVQGM